MQAFDFMDRPPAGALVRALEQLLALGALGADGKLTAPLGRRMARLPVEPAFAKVKLRPVAERALGTGRSCRACTGCLRCAVLPGPPGADGPALGAPACGARLGQGTKTSMSVSEALSVPLRTLPKSLEKVTACDGVRVLFSSHSPGWIDAQ